MTKHTDQTLMQSLSRHFGENYGSDEKKIAAISVMVELGMITVGAPAHKIIDRDPIEEVRVAKTADEATAMMMRGWRMLGASRSEPFEFAMARPRSVASEAETA